MNDEQPTFNVRSHRDLLVWQEAMTTAEMTHTSTKKWPADERFDLTSQTRRAANSVAANIAEGHGRGGDNEFRQFLRIASGSLSELSTHLELAYRYRYVSEDEFLAHQNQLAKVGRLLGAFIRSLDQRNQKLRETDSADYDIDDTNFSSLTADSRQPTATKRA